MNPDEKSQKRATDIIAAHGAEQSAWPEAERASTLDALQSSDELRQILSAEASLDSLLQQSARVYFRVNVSFWGNVILFWA